MNSIPDAELGEAIPSNTEHAISVSLPTWRSNVGYEENENWVVSKMRSGYPRFFIHPEIIALEKSISGTYGKPQERCMLFPSAAIAAACKSFIASRPRRPEDNNQVFDQGIRIIYLTSSRGQSGPHPQADVWAVFLPELLYPIAREFWQHTGEGISSRRAVFVHKVLRQGHLSLIEESTDTPSENNPLHRGPSRYSKHCGGNTASGSSLRKQSNISSSEGMSTNDFVEMRYGRNLEADAVQQAKLAIKQRISGSMAAGADFVAQTSTQGRVQKLSPEDVFLFPTGMSAIYNTHRLLRTLFGPSTMVEFGFPYLDTLKVLEKFGDGCLFLGNGNDADLDELERVINDGKKISALFCEFPSNPLLRSPNLKRLRDLATQHRFVIVVDETIGNFVNVDVLPYADILVSSLTKVFSGDSNVMGGSCVINPKMPFYQDISTLAAKMFADNYWGEDAIFMERNSRDFASRVVRINENADALAELFLKWPKIIKRVYYPKHDESRGYYDDSKGPSLGTNFTLTSPYALLAHYKELNWIAQYGVESHLIRISVGLEEKTTLLYMFEKALSDVASFGNST
ncbi:uncharacterized protein DFL_009564 [Arthrobotrys flagrans]|uniref:Cystathionine gamma-synthase n=1 Tax=Arthrobotrys flagrans TaxID=97331 RepID=A0A436ZS27_ARTFL|nr:hypothetical protein DFL_009564 [Arthrobotrys flagrans]